jgi:putative colanic acid biosynthesis acetyltransferase WcaF
MGMVTSSISIEAGTWITTRCMIQGGSNLGVSCLVTPLTVVRGSFPANSVVSGNPGITVGRRFE